MHELSNVLVASSMRYEIIFLPVYSCFSYGTYTLFFLGYNYILLDEHTRELISAQKTSHKIKTCVSVDQRTALYKVINHYYRLLFITSKRRLASKFAYVLYCLIRIRVLYNLVCVCVCVCVCARARACVCVYVVC